MFFLQVAICGAAPGMVHSVRLHNDCSSSELQVDLQGKVFSSDSHSFSEFHKHHSVISPSHQIKTIRNTLILQANL